MTRTERYLELGLRLGRHEPELVDSYYGPPELRQRIEDEPLVEPARLAADAAKLLAELDDRWLASQVCALETTARTLAGEELPYADEVELTYGIRPRWIDEREFERAQAELDEALPGSGDLATRYARWFEEQAVPPQAVEGAVDAAMALVRERSRAAIGLPEGEEIELEIVTGERWFGYAHYLGGFRTRIIRQHRPVVSGRRPALVRGARGVSGPPTPTARGRRPTSCAARAGSRRRSICCGRRKPSSRRGSRRRDRSSFSAATRMRSSPSACGRSASNTTPRSERASAEARRMLYAGSSNVAILLHERGASHQEAWDYAAHWSLQPADRVDKILANVKARRSRGYVHTYSEGRRLCHAFVDGEPARLRRLVTARLLPDELETEAAAER